MPVTPSRVATRHLVPDVHLKVANTGAENAAYLSSLPPQMKSDILRNVAKHYGVSVAEIEDELTDPDAEALYEYIANDNALRMLVYRGFKRAASVKVADQLWDDLGLQDEMGAVLERVKQDIQQEIYGLTQRLQRVERAWERGDVRALMYEGVITKSDKAHIDAAWEAQQAGNEAGMYEHLEDVRVDLVKFASEKRASSQDIIDSVLSSHDVYKLIKDLEKGEDEQSADLAARVYSHLAAKLRLSDNEGAALNRMKGSVQRIGEWDAATQRNNIFKAADLLGMKLPSHFFASEQKMETREATIWDRIPDYSRQQARVRSAVPVAETALGEVLHALSEMAKWVEANGGQSAPTLQQAAVNVGSMQADIHKVLRLVR